MIRARSRRSTAARCVAERGGPTEPTSYALLRASTGIGPGITNVAATWLLRVATFGPETWLRTRPPDTEHPFDYPGICRTFAVLRRDARNGGGRIRTCDRQLRRLLLYPLSYAPRF
jgi:hypothetical protein